MPLVCNRSLECFHLTKPKLSAYWTTGPHSHPSNSWQPPFYLLFLSTYFSCFTKWNYVVFIFLSLAYFTEHNVLKFQPHCSRIRNYFLKVSNISLCVYITFCLSSSLIGEHLGCFHLLATVNRSMHIWRSSTLFFHSGSTISHPYQQCTKVSVYPYLHLFLLFIYLFFSSGHLSGCEVISCGFYLNFPDDWGSIFDIESPVVLALFAGMLSFLHWIIFVPLSKIHWLYLCRSIPGTCILFCRSVCLYWGFGQRG
jgi:hypothetical protein